LCFPMTNSRKSKFVVGPISALIRFEKGLWSLGTRDYDRFESLRG